MDRTDIYFKDSNIYTYLNLWYTPENYRAISGKKKNNKKNNDKKLRLAHHKNSLLKISIWSKKFSYRDIKDVMKTYIFIYV